MSSQPTDATGAIAIVGMSLRVPGARTPEEYWKNLCDGVEMIRPRTDEELLAAGEAQERLQDPRYVKAASVLEQMEYFDPEFFGLSPKEGGIMDPQHRHLLECAWETVEDSGHIPETFEGQIGVWAGCGMGAYFMYNILSNRELVDSTGLFLLRHTGNDKDFLATRISYALNLRGPSVGVQTACSTSLVAVHYACRSLLSGECDMALAGGVTIELPHARGYMFEQGEILSPDGHCRAFDHKSAGTVFGSGAGMVALRRLEDAVADGDRIYAVIAGTAVNNDGSGKVGYLAPSVEGQAAAVTEALAVAGVAADSIGYVECHGTGTAVGDPIEIAALTAAFRETTQKRGYCAVGSVKTNIGHLDTAAGVASLIKAALCVHHGKLPPSLNFEKPNPLIDFAATPFYVNTKLRDFPEVKGQPRRASINSLGVGGTNAHAIVQAPPKAAAAQKPASAPGPQLLVWSGRARSVLDESAQRLLAHLRANPDVSLADVAHTLQVGRKHFNERRVLAARDTQHAIELLERADPRKIFTHGALESTSVVFMFPGGGAQYPDMGRHLYAQEPVFREHMDHGLDLLKTRVDYDPRALLFPKPEAREEARASLEQPSLQLPLIFIIEYALAQLWMAWGVKPAVLIGHSVGENTAAAVAGVLSFDNALDLVLLRGRLFDEVPPGGMLSVPLSAKELTPYLRDDLDLACVNAPELSVASGPRAALARLHEELAERDVQAQPIRIHVAAHSRMLDPILDRFSAFLQTLKLSAPNIPIMSNRTGELLTPEQARSASYWVEHLRRTVNFGDGIGTLLEQPGRVFLEVGPGRALSSLARLHPKVADGQAFIGSLPHPDDDTPDNEVFLAAYGRLWAAGVQLPLERTRSGDGKLIRLPTYAFNHKRYWVEPQALRAEPTSRVYPTRVAELENMFFAPTFRPHYPDFDADLKPHTWLVFVDQTGLGAQLVERLKSSGHDVVIVREGDAYVKVSDGEYRLAPEQDSEAYEQLLRDVLASGKTPDRVAHLWLLADREVFRPGSTFFHRNQECGFYSLLFLGQALAAVDLSTNLHIAVVSRGMQHAGSARGMHPDQATILGPVKVIPRELPGVTCISIDLEGESEQASTGWLEAVPFIQKAAPKIEQLRAAVLPGAAAPALTSDPARELEALMAELRLPPSNGEVALTQNGRYERRYERLKLPAARSVQLRHRGVYLLTGGFGGIGLALARSLAQQEKARLVLVNRHPLPMPAERERWLEEHPTDATSARIRSIQQLESLGAEVLVCSGDVADIDRMQEIVAEAEAHFGPLNGVIHAAGVLDDAPIAIKRQPAVEQVFGPKVYGTLVLDSVLRDKQLDFFVVFSSTSTAIAAAGQVDYVAANAFLDAYAEQARALGRNVLSLAWGVWREVGLAVSAGERLGGESAAKESRAMYPLFSGKAETPGGATVLRGTFQGASHWILADHRNSQGLALLPGTGYLELARAALREVGHDGPFVIEDLYFLRALAVPDNENVDFRVRLTPTDDGFSFEVHTKVRLASGHEGYVLHAQAVLRRFTRLRPDNIDPAVLRARCTQCSQPEAQQSYRVVQEKHLRFGPRWSNMRSYAFGNQEAVAHVRLEDKFQQDVQSFGLHPGLLDIATGFALELAPSYGAGDKLWVPVAYDKVIVYSDLEPELHSHVRAWTTPAASGGKVVSLVNTEPEGAFARFDIRLADKNGRVLMEIKGFSMQALSSNNFEITAPRQQDLEEDASKRELSGPERAFFHNLSLGITPAEGADAFRRAVTSMARARIMFTSIDVRELQRQADAFAPTREQAGASTFERPSLSSEYIAPRNDVERALAGMWESLLGVANVGVRDNFFELGGHSLIAVRLFARMKKTFGADFPISTLIAHPTIEACAGLLPMSTQVRAAASPESMTAQRFRHIVPMNPPGTEQRGRLPFFLVAGMFGNVMNLRHLAGLVGEDRPFHGVQARGLMGREEPHETFEEMASDYLAEIRAVQPNGPYLLGGFSGGGIAAYEIARQLVEAGEQVPLLVLLDTPLPFDAPLTRRERMLIHKQNFERQGARFVVKWLEKKVAYREELRERERSRATQAQNTDPANFRSQLIEAAFYRALDRYQIEPLPVHILLCRPKLRPTHTFGEGQAINKDRRRIYHDNGWSRYSSSVEVFESPGNHDSMVLEPNVRILASRLRPALNEAEQSTRSEALYRSSSNRMRELKIIPGASQAPDVSEPKEKRSRA
ncbi:MAG TPA: SDR family NAD(P)-dependent oxidoreductase [Polyangiales bacterium]|nr:SDR family NAD(P)-dependent oxidoreductase [Polyangiales bacterium]